MAHAISRRRFSVALAGAAALAAAGRTSAQSAATAGSAAPSAPARLKVGVLLPRSGLQGFVGQSCQQGADLAPGVLRELLGVVVVKVTANTESSVDTARTRAERLIQ